MKGIDLTEIRNANELKKFKFTKDEKTGGYVIAINFTGECVKNYRPDALYNITGIADLSEMIQDNHLKMMINGEEYWIPFVKKIRKEE